MSPKTGTSRKFSEQERINHLEALVEASKIINSTLDLEQLLNLILTTALDNTSAEAGTIYLLDSAKNEIWSKVLQGDKKIEIRLPLGKGIAGNVAQTGETINLTDAYADMRFDREFDKQSGFKTQNMLCMPMRNNAGETIGVFQILNKKNSVFGQDDEEFLDALSIHASLAVTNAKLYKEALEKKRLEGELELAREIQEHLLPQCTPIIPGYEFAAINNSCYQVGGDYYDYIEGQRSHVGFAIGDVSGKGIPASLLMATLRGGLHSQMKSRRPLTNRIESLNKLICQCTSLGKFITFFYGELFQDTGEISYVNCGHNPPIHATDDDDIITLHTGGLILGLVENTEFEEGALTLNPNDVLVLYTDGVNEAMNKRKQEYTMERLIKTVKKCKTKSASEIMDDIIESVSKFTKGAPQADDITLMIIKRVK